MEPHRTSSLWEVVFNAICGDGWDGMEWMGLVIGHGYSKSTFGANKDFFTSFLVDYGQSSNTVKDIIDICRSCCLFFRFAILFHFYFFFSVQNHNRST